MTELSVKANLRGCAQVKVARGQPAETKSHRSGCANKAHPVTELSVKANLRHRRRLRLPFEGKRPKLKVVVIGGAYQAHPVTELESRFK